MSCTSRLEPGATIPCSANHFVAEGEDFIIHLIDDDRPDHNPSAVTSNSNAHNRGRLQLIMERHKTGSTILTRPGAQVRVKDQPRGMSSAPAILGRS